MLRSCPRATSDIPVRTQSWPTPLAPETSGHLIFLARGSGKGSNHRAVLIVGGSGRRRFWTWRICVRALAWHGKGDIRCEEVPDPKIEHPRDAIINVTACAICGSDLHI